MSSSSSFTPQKLLLLFLTIFAVQSVMLLFLILRPLSASAQRAGGDDLKKAQIGQGCDCAKQGKIDTTRLYIPIPGVTDACGFVCDINEDGRGDIVDYIFTVYKLLIGIAAVVAFAMIVYAGYEWIFAMGNSGKISDAKERIMSACIGLALALVSVQFLQTLSPQLTNLYLPDVTKIARASVNPFCRGNDYVVNQTITASSGTTERQKEIEKILTEAKNEDVKLVSKNGADAPQCKYEYPVAMRLSGDTLFCYLGNRDKCAKIINLTGTTTTVPLTGEDGKVVNITMEKISTYQPKEALSCVGSSCTQSDQSTENVCYPSDPYARSFECKSAQNACEDTDDKRNGCEEVNKWLASQGYTDKQCAKAVKTAQRDACILGKLLKCTPDYPNQMEGDNVFRELAKNTCWEAKGQSEAVLKDCGGLGVKLYPVLSGNAIQGASALCCRRPFVQEAKTDYSCVTDYIDKGNTVVEMLALVQQLNVNVEKNTPGHYFGNDCNEGTAYLSDKEGKDCHILGFYPDAYDVVGTCQKKEGEYGKETITRGVCVPKDENKYDGFQVCWGYNPYDQMNNNYNAYSLCMEKEKQQYKCSPYLLSTSFHCIGETGGGGGGGGDVIGVINTEIENAVEAVVNNNLELKNAFSSQQIGFQSKPPPFGANTAFAAPEPIDACTFVQAIIAKESGGEPDPVNACNVNAEKRTVDCGLMQKSISIPSGTLTPAKNTEECRSICRDAGFLDINKNISAGVDVLEEAYSNPCPADPPGFHTSCNAVKNNEVNGDKRYKYALTAYNGGLEANNLSGDNGDKICTIQEDTDKQCCSKPCSQLNDECFINTTRDNIYPTKVECPNDPGDYKYTKESVSKIEDFYKSLKNTGGAGVASCPAS